MKEWVLEERRDSWPREEKEEGKSWCRRKVRGEGGRRKGDRPKDRQTR